jgi:hypothetical protein
MVKLRYCKVLYFLTNHKKREEKEEKDYPSSVSELVMVSIVQDAKRKKS